MTPTSSLKRGNTFSRSALGLALSLGVATGAFVAQPAFAAKKNEQPAGPKIEFSPAFTKVAAELDKTITGARTNAAVQTASQQVRAATDPAAKAAAVAQVDAALGGGFKAKLDAATAVASTPGDKLKLGEMTQTYAGLINDQALQYKGLVMMLESGVLAPDMQGKVAWFAGVSAYQAHDYVSAAKYVQQAKDGGYTDPQLDAVLNDSYRRSNNPAAALANAQRDIAAAKAAGTKPSETSIRTALQASYDGKQTAQAIDLAVLLVQNYPSQKAWNASINVVRALSGYQSQEALDLMRLMGRTNSYDNERDYIEYIQAVDPRRLPGEAQKVLDSGLAAGKLRAADPFVTEAKGIVAGRLTADRASLPGLERDARAANASAATVAGAGDAFLSYGDAAKAEALYTLALSKPGADNERMLTRIGIAQADQGKAAEAEANFAKVQGPRKAIAQLWSAYAAQKGGGAAPVAAAQ
ncbi:hypothetical protein KRR38_05520 [Novosphingobium sp. G106]|uniref:hypothetical protein n=1 Tax=Novosphingobium sp. G106 TaxID=2849500 RepID=UPI001C2D85DB|nr:hypothetical protein [Novosphingobium sp. G106]MBV1687146.1 hypothetical protein [Novosphingobium sp. G106]